MNAAMSLSLFFDNRCDFSTLSSDLVAEVMLNCWLG
jgi:hypothetical protein